MTSFLPYPDFQKSINILDIKRLWKQVIEQKIIICNITPDSLSNTLPINFTESKSFINKSYINNPAIRMWIPFRDECIHYYNLALERSYEVEGIETDLPYLSCKYSHSNRSSFNEVDVLEKLIRTNVKFNNPWWNIPEFNDVHKGILYMKDPEHYSIFKECFGINDSKYKWPINESKSFYSVT